MGPADKTSFFGSYQQEPLLKMGKGTDWYKTHKQWEEYFCS